MIHKVLRLVRQFHELSQTEMAVRLGISKSFLSEIESGKKIVSLELLNKYSQEFEISPSSLVFFSESLGNPKSNSERFRKFFTGKVVDIMDWIITKHVKTQVKT